MLQNLRCQFNRLRIIAFLLSLISGYFLLGKRVVWCSWLCSRGDGESDAENQKRD
ncbi:4Fe-4S binding protein [uncultured Gimesia sp.]|uniref:4Fe-4S binding protein n=1 Tax=uncultured Gimesia sp. TaxID=1678688 RepID=UPI003452955B